MTVSVWTGAGCLPMAPPPKRLWVEKKTGRNPTDRGKLGVKRSLLSEARGVPVALVIAGANRHDLPLLEYTLESIPPRLEVRRQRLLRRARAKALTRSQNLCLDKGFDSAKAHRIADEFGLCPHIRSRGEEAAQKQEGKKARRWVVECGHSWINRYRALLIRWNKKTANYLAFLHLACANLTLNRLTR